MKIEASPDEVASLLNQYKTTIQPKSSTGELVYEDVPVMIARAEIMSNIYSELEGIVGESATGVLKKIGKSYGEMFYALISNGPRSHLLADKEKIFNFVCAETEAIGWGRISIEELPNKFIIIADQGMATGRNYNGESQHPVDSYFLGYFEGFLSKLNNTIYYGVETECVAKGDGCCKMEFGTEPVF